MKTLWVCSYLLAIVLVSARQIKTEDVVIALDCGTDQTYKSFDDIIYQPDTLYSQNSKVADYSQNQAIMKKTIKYTDDQELYKTERHADDFFAYSLPIPENGTYTLVLKFCELYFTEPGKRVFNVLFGSTIIVSNLDIVKEVGPFAAYDLYTEFEFKDKQIIQNGKVCQNSFDHEHHGLIVEFRKIGKDLPKVDAILLLRGGIEDSNQAEYNALVKNWSDEAELISEDLQYQKLESLHKQIKDEFDSSIDLDSNQSTLEGITQILFSWKGILIFAVLFIFQMGLFLSQDPKETMDAKKKVVEEHSEKKETQQTAKHDSKKKK